MGYSAISRLLNRNPAYIQQFIKRGSPRKLDDEDRRILARFFGVDEQVLGGPALPVRDGLVEVPILNVDASAGFGAIAESEMAHTRFGFDERWLDGVTERARRRLPCLTGNAVERARCWAGWYEMSPDGHAILGPAPETPNLFLANGSSGHGVMHSPAIGRLVAEMVLDGEATSLDVSALAPDRFARGKGIVTPDLF